MTTPGRHMMARLIRFRAEAGDAPSPLPPSHHCSTVREPPEEMVGRVPGSALTEHSGGRQPLVHGRVCRSPGHLQPAPMPEQSRTNDALQAISWPTHEAPSESTRSSKASAADRSRPVGCGAHLPCAAYLTTLGARSLAAYVKSGINAKGASTSGGKGVAMAAERYGSSPLCMAAGRRSSASQRGIPVAPWMSRACRTPSHG